MRYVMLACSFVATSVVLAYDALLGAVIGCCSGIGQQWPIARASFGSAWTTFKMAAPAK